MDTLTGHLSAKNLRIAIVGSCFNQPIADALVSGAQQTFLQCGGSADGLLTIRVPGAFEVPCTIKKLLSSGKKFDAIVACGVLIQGETDHYNQIVNQVASGIATLTLEFCLPITFSVVTAPSPQIAWERAGIKGCHLGISGMTTAIEMATLFSQI
ncbi:6,7-dimethyl-8-ribityllumazine synthase,6,7-dimethyl-8-ribityllumazine synthase,6,7-dimethyl-8-ribityllumazine synthase,6,7-dimethyl-8-ribityllumazine synthase [Chlamydia serpentis]|uniref:6,7-dimethyl-8-ribityllumazine synthase n=1 Tax=Chlamydia serpentis TaxID=1967782 RepID=A0A2R8FC22_9CHLA|nr:6,7-dimethyl-8-ribityllumazine synthase [Chlamydia serpentis]SPN73985.1 6,7-dimethyl-8-ribityllumazine synthase,6,7-dimethyl-8-ribityllumazine synthase,6,7-dimethyl-8-ribityllumazine synthase,6,7-dimethyl-8-ribityllumazine synthase [Chlamydia serpentis]